MDGGQSGRERRHKGALLWILALVLMLGAAVFQRLTGPTTPRRGRFAWGGATLAYRLPRSGSTDLDTRVALPYPEDGASGILWFRHFPTDEPWIPVPLRPEERDGKRELAALLPRQPASGKLEYRLELADGRARIPADGPSLVIRFKDPVPAPLLAAHVLAMFLGMLIGLRAGLAALCKPDGMHPLAWTAMICVVLGGLVLGPFVQKAAFGAYWTGFPLGTDPTDTKTLLMVLGWLLACGTLLRWPRRTALGRVAVALAALVMTLAYLIPHSLRGSAMDYRVPGRESSIRGK